MTITDPRIARLITLIRAALRPPAGAGRIVLALGMGLICHALFAAGVLAMIVAMFFGLSESLGSVPWPWAFLANAALIVQFPMGHSLLLTGPGGRFMARLIPGHHGRALATTTYAIIASAQLLALFTLGTPSGIVWWRAEGAAFWAVTAAYGASWLLLLKASFDAGAEALAARGSHVTGIDPAVAAIEAARNHARGAGLHIGYDVGVGEALPYDDAGFDAVVCVDVLEHVTDRHKVLSEVARVLRPGGLFLFDTINRNPMARLATITVAEDLLRLLPRGTHDPAMFIKPGELRRAMQGAGFVPGPVTGLGPRGMNRRLDLTFGPLPLTAILYMGIARKPAFTTGDSAC